MTWPLQVRINVVGDNEVLGLWAQGTEIWLLLGENVIKSPVNILLPETTCQKGEFVMSNINTSNMMLEGSKMCPIFMIQFVISLG